MLLFLTFEVTSNPPFMILLSYFNHMHTLTSQLLHPPMRQCLTLLLDTTQTLIKYIIHLGDLWANNMWESRGYLLYYTEFLSDTLILVATLAHYVHIMVSGNFSML